MTINMENFEMAFRSGFGKPSVDVKETIDKFERGERLFSDEPQVIDFYCALYTYLHLENQE